MNASKANLSILRKNQIYENSQDINIKPLFEKNKVLYFEDEINNYYSEIDNNKEINIKNALKPIDLTIDKNFEDNDAIINKVSDINKSKLFSDDIHSIHQTNTYTTDEKKDYGIQFKIYNEKPEEPIELEEPKKSYE